MITFRCSCHENKTEILIKEEDVLRVRPKLNVTTSTFSEKDPDYRDEDDKTPSYCLLDDYMKRECARSDS